MRGRFGEKGITMGLQKGGKAFNDAFCEFFLEENYFNFRGNRTGGS